MFVEKFNQLMKSHEGKFHDASSLQEAYLTDMIQELIDSGFLVEPVIINGNWYEIDTLEDLERVKKIVKS